MLQRKAKTTGMSWPMNAIPAGGLGVSDLELRPGGMLVQKRNSDSNQSCVPIPTIRVRVKYGSSCHEISISSQANFGELKKMLAEPTGLHPQDQKLLFKDKERDSKAYLDVAGVKDRSKIVVIEDVANRERRCLELRRSATMEKAMKSISEISFEVDNLFGKVTALESVISSGGKVAEKDVLNLIELLMTQLIKLDGINADGDAKLQRRMQVRRVQKYIETLDLLKVRNSMTSSNGGKIPLQQQQKHSIPQMPVLMQPQRKQQEMMHWRSGPVMVTTKWEAFDSSMVRVPLPSASTSTPSTTNPNAKINWEVFM